jgi:hypothetical protein
MDCVVNHTRAKPPLPEAFRRINGNDLHVAGRMNDGRVIVPKIDRSRFCHALPERNAGEGIDEIGSG